MVADERSEEMKRVVLMALGVLLALALASPMGFAQSSSAHRRPGRPESWLLLGGSGRYRNPQPTTLCSKAIPITATHNAMGNP